MPGRFTRQAWEGSIEAAIDEAARHNRIAGDWALGNTGASHVGTDTNAQSPEALRAALRARYFADYAEHWQTLMNSLRCDAAPTLPAAMAGILAYARLIAASLGEQWTAMGAELFVRSVSQATPTVLDAAQATDGPPPLPKAAIEAARKAEIALPGGRGALWRSVEITHRASGSSSRRR